MVDWYAFETIDYIWDNPYASIPVIPEVLAAAGPCPSRTDLIHLFGGPAQFKEDGALRRRGA